MLPRTLVLVALMSASGVLAGTTTAGTLCGTVRDATTNDPVAQAGVVLRLPTGAFTGLSTGTGLDGSFCLASVPAGTYDLEVLRDDFRVAYLRGVVVNEDAVAVDVVLAPGVALAAPVPNPAALSTRLAWSLPAPGNVRLRIVDAAGRFVRGWSGDRAAGSGSLTWDLRDAQGRVVGAGVYQVILESGGARSTRTLVRIR